MSDDFIDSNVILYLFDRDDVPKRLLTRSLLENALRQDNASISFQVVQEVLNVVTTKLQPSASSRTTDAVLRTVLMPLWRVMPTLPLYQRAIEIHDRFRYSFYDSLIIAAAIEEGCTRLLTEDMQHGQVIDGLTIENPFLVS